MNPNQPTPLRIRREQPADSSSIRQVTRAAFESDAEATLVDLLRARARPLLSLVALLGSEDPRHDESDAIVGHIMFSPVTLPGDEGLRAMGLAPMAVLPARQRQGIGSALVEEGLRHCRLMGVDAVVVLGHPEFYPRFGFVPAAQFGLQCEYDVPSEAFMALELTPSALSGRRGTLRYHEAFASL